MGNKRKLADFGGKIRCSVLETLNVSVHCAIEVDMYSSSFSAIARL